MTHLFTAAAVLLTDLLMLLFYTSVRFLYYWLLGVTVICKDYLLTSSKRERGHLDQSDLSDCST